MFFYVTQMTVFHVYANYKQAFNSGKRNIRFESNRPVAYKRNPVTCDSGTGAADIQSGDY